MYEIGRLCLKIAGRDANKKCLIVNVIDEQFVMIDGQTRRRKCNIIHLEPLDKVIKIKKDASNKDVVAALVKEGIECKETSTKEKKKSTDRPKKTKAKKEKKIAEKKPKKKSTGPSVIKKAVDKLKEQKLNKE
jgi:large subunit ribosomal protein L14e